MDRMGELLSGAEGIAPYDPTFREKAKMYLSEVLGLSPRVASGIMGSEMDPNQGIAGMGLADFVPGMNAGMGLQEGRRALDQGRNVDAALAGGSAMLDAIPVVGGAAKMAGKKVGPEIARALKAEDGSFGGKSARFFPRGVAMSQGPSQAGKSEVNLTHGRGNPTPTVPAVHRGADPVPAELALRGPVGARAGNVAGETHTPGYDPRAGRGAGQPDLLSPTPTMQELLGERAYPFEAVRPEDLPAFHEAQKAAQASRGVQGKAVDVYPPEKLAQGYKAFQTPGGGASFAVSPEGELSSVVSATGTGPKGVGEAVLNASSGQGADWLQAFDIGLPEAYAKGGYRPVARMPFAPEYFEADHGKEALDAFQKRFANSNGGNPDLVFMARDPSFTGRNAPGKGGVRTDDWDEAMRLTQAERQRMQGRRTPTEATYVDPRATGRVDGSLANPKEVDVTWQGRAPDTWSPQDWHDFGAAHGVPNLGPKDAKAWQAGLKTYQTDMGEISIPGGDGPFTYYDLLHIKEQGIDPNRIPPKVHDEIHRRMVAGVSQNELSDEAVTNGLLMGMISPNNPLTPNELALQRVMVKGPQDLKALGDMAGYDYATDALPGQKARQATSRQISQKLGLGAASRGGLGASGSANYTDIAEMAQKMRDRPDFFRFDTRKYEGMNESEKWAQFVTEVMNETRGLKAKTGSFSTVWQDPQKASISAIDRHMATLFKDDMFPSTKERHAWQKRVIAAYNASAKEKGRKKVTSWPQFEKAPGARGVFVDQAMMYVNNMKGMKTRTKTGDFNKNLPEQMRKVDWVGKEPEKVQTLGKPYTRALDANAKRAEADGLGLFSSQWKEWDKIRGRIEPHEIMFRGLERLPRMSMPQMRKVRDVHAKSGYMTSPGAVRPSGNASKLGYFSMGGILGLPALTEEEERKRTMREILGGT